MIFLDRDNVTIHQGNCLDILKEMPNDSVHCCVTSPPYWGLRDYGVEGQLGLEADYREYVDKLVVLFREVRRVLRNDGTLWLNLGDGYTSGGRKLWRSGASSNKGHSVLDNATHRPQTPSGLKPKDLVGIPWRVAFALQDDGWYLRQDIIWAKPAPMPESVRDRCTKAHEYLFLLAKSQRYHFDSDAIAEPCQSSLADLNRATVTGRGEQAAAHARGNDRDKSGGFPNRGRAAGNKRHKYVDQYQSSDSEEHRTKAGLMKIADKAFHKRNKRSVWTVNTKPYPGAHFATFPPELVKPCILAGCPEGGTVLDPFGGSGTTAEVAQRLGRKSVLIELNPDYCQLSKQRIKQRPLF